ncbi:hypothetical protein BSKO_11633 [Bryopsis sp. KO-2023]|nr:hypothetical protein BSKO_11633 [Bryopsis sp. KO-2023]
MDAEILSEFERSSFSFGGEETLSKCARLADVYGLNAVELSENFEVFAIQRDLKTNVISETLLGHFSAYLQKVNGKENEKNEVIPHWRDHGQSTNVEQFDFSFLDEGTFSAPKQRSLEQASTSNANSSLTSPGETFLHREQRGQVVFVLNEQIPEESAFVMDSDDNQLEIKHVGKSLSCEQKFMSNTIEDKVRAIESRIVDFVDRLKKETGIEATEPVSIQTQDPVWVAGRICCDAEGRLNQESILLEGSLQYSGGSRVKLDVSRMADFSLFPGQVVVVNGLNPTGGKLMALGIIGHLPRPFRTVEQGTLRKVKILAAGGPFTTTEDFSYSPLKEFVEACKRESPDVVLLVGPFVDAEHPKIASLDVTFDKLYKDQIRPLLEELQASCPTVMVIPSTRDAHCFPVFPQPPFLSVPDGVSSIPNPCSFVVGGCLFGTSSQDVVKHMSMGVSEKLVNPGNSDRISRLWQHVLGQGSFYPLYPPPLGTCLDTSHSHCLDFANTPDVVFIPSDLAPSAKIVSLPTPKTGVDGALSIRLSERTAICVNPGRLAKGQGGGTYASVVIVGSTGDIRERCKIKITRI